MNTKTKRITAGIAAAAALALVPGIWYASTASAAMSADTKRLCQQNCTVGFPLSAGTEGVTEGSTVKTTLQGKPGTYSVRAYVGLGRDKDGKATSIKPVGPVTKVTVAANGYSEPTAVKVDPLKAPLFGGQTFTVQMADATDARQLVPAAQGRDASTFSVNSHRAQVTKTNSVPNQNNFTRLQYGIPGDRYQMQLKDPQKGWVSITVTDCVISGKQTGVGAVNSCDIEWAYPAGLTSQPELRVVNLADQQNPVWTSDKQQATTKPTTVKPTNAPTTVKPTTVKPTNAPTTVKPTTVKPTSAPTTGKPTTVKPTTVKPTNAPTTGTPTTGKPTTVKPTNAPTTGTPTTEPTATVAPTAEPTPGQPTEPQPTEPQPTASPKGGETSATPTTPSEPQPTDPPVTGPATPTDGGSTGTDAGSTGDPVQDSGFGGPADAKDSKDSKDHESVGGLASTGD